MKKSAKGFTLIELLAVIVILAIIALIATPIVLNLIDKARKGAAESSAYAYVNAAEKAAVVTLMDNTGVNLGGATCTVGSTKTELTCSGGTISTASPVSLSLDIKGDLPSSGGTISFDDKGSVTGASFTINGYGVVVDDKGKATISTTTATTPAESSSEASSSEDSTSTSSSEMG